MKIPDSILLGLSVLSSAGVSAAEPAAAEYRFNVYLDGSRIGVHEFQIREPEPGTTVVRSEADFDVNFLFFTAFEYDHENTERWNNGCLAEISAFTNSNGKRSRVEGQKTDSAFVVQRDDSTEELPQCVMTFAYWNPAFLQQDKLLNPQTGQYLKVDVEPAGEQELEVNGQRVPATAYRVEAPERTVTVWYAKDDRRWLALEAPAKGGRTLRYELS
jgi:hypothetical protein